MSSSPSTRRRFLLAHGSAEICRNEENCLTYPTGDAGALASQLRRLAADSELRFRLGTAGLETARQLTLTRQVVELERIFGAEIERAARTRSPRQNDR